MGICEIWKEASVSKHGFWNMCFSKALAFPIPHGLASVHREMPERSVRWGEEAKTTMEGHRGHVT